MKKILKTSLANKIAIATLVITIIGVASSFFAGTNTINQSTHGDSSPNINTKGNINITIK